MNVEFPATKHVARKKYTCNACEWIDALLPYGLSDYDLAYSELKAIVKARKNAWQIMPGDLYVRQARLEDGQWYIWRGLVSIHAICAKHDIYEWE